MAASGSPWIEITGGATGDGSNPVSYELFPNTNATPRVGLVTAAGRNHSVSQEALDRGVIVTYAGNKESGVNCDHCQATIAQIYVGDMAVDTNGDLFIRGYERVHRVEAESGLISTVALTASGEALALDSSGGLYVTRGDGMIERIDAATGEATTVAGTGETGYSGDGGPALDANIRAEALAVDSLNNIYLTDPVNRVVRMVNAATGIISTVAGTGTSGYSGDGGPATAAQLSEPEALAFDGGDNLFIAGNNAIRRVDAGTGVISTVESGLGNIKGMTFDKTGNLFFTEYDSRIVRRLSTQTGLLTIVAGSGYQGYSGDGGSALEATMDGPTSVAVDLAGNLYIGDHWNRVVRKVAGGPAASDQVSPARAGIFRDGLWALDTDGDGALTGADRSFYHGTTGDIPVIGDWNGDGHQSAGIFRNGMWVLDVDGDGVIDLEGDDKAHFLGRAGDRPVVGDWDGSGSDKIGIYRNGLWALDYDGNGLFQFPGPDWAFFHGGAGDTPLVGDWDGSGSDKIGIYRNGLWALDYNGDGLFQFPGTDKAFFHGIAGDNPIVGDWNGSGSDKIGIFRNGLWALDYDGDHVFTFPGTDKAFFHGLPGDEPVIGDWNGSNSDKIGIFRSGLWALDNNGDFIFTPGEDQAFLLGTGGDVAVVGAW